MISIRVNPASLSFFQLTFVSRLYTFGFVPYRNMLSRLHRQACPSIQTKDLLCRIHSVKFYCYSFRGSENGGKTEGYGENLRAFHEIYYPVGTSVRFTISGPATLKGSQMFEVNTQ
jgi:hypothetical protein